MLEFTGERVVPGAVDPSLFHEHRARYRFAAWFAAFHVPGFGPGAAILDAGCGTGYGTGELAELTTAAPVTAFDISAEAVRYARDHFSGPRVRLVQAACELFPFADGSFDLVVAFEVIEHLERWQEFLNEAKRVLKPAGVLLVSTPNRDYYAESRAGAGPNPFHVREFDRGEFASALEAAFPHVAMWTQNYLEGLGFLPARGRSGNGALDAPEEREPDNAYFFLAACSRVPVSCTESFAYIPVSGNILREKEHHVALLEGELAQKNVWLRQLEDAHATLNRAHQELVAELQEHNAWATRLDGELTRASRRIVELQDAIGAANIRFQEKVAAMEQEAATRLGWVHDLESQIVAGQTEIKRLNLENTDIRVAFEERTLWGEEKARDLVRVTGEWQAAAAEVARLQAVLAAVGDSKWVRLGRAVHLGPTVPGSDR